MSFGGMWDSHVTVRTREPEVAEWGRPGQPARRAGLQTADTRSSTRLLRTLHAYRSSTNDALRPRARCSHDVSDAALDARHTSPRQRGRDHQDLDPLPAVRPRGSDLQRPRRRRVCVVGRTASPLTTCSSGSARARRGRLHRAARRSRARPGAALRHSLSDRVTAARRGNRRSELSAHNMTAHIQRVQGQAGGGSAADLDLGAAGVSHLACPKRRGQRGRSRLERVSIISPAR